MDNQFAEQALIACLLNDGACSTEVSVTADDFENAQYAQIYRAIMALVGGDTVMDVITVAEHLQHSTSRNWMPVLIELAGGVGTSSNVKAYGQIIQQSARARAAAAIGSHLIENKHKPEAVQNAIRALMEIGREQASHEYSLGDAIKLGVTAIDEAFRNKGAIIGVSTGLDSLNEILGGYHPGDLVIIGARPAVGKTAVMFNQMIGAQKMVGCISGEQGIVQGVQRLLAMAGKVSLSSMRNGRMSEQDWNALQTAATVLKGHPGMMFNDKPAPSMEEVESNARRWKYEHDIQALYVDYLQRIKRDPKKPKHEAVGDNAVRLKELARELGIPVIALAQVKRDVKDARPRMGDLADSSEIEKEADLIMLLHREGANDPDADDTKLDIIIDKNRHGATGVITADWDGRFLKLSDMIANRSHY